MALWDSSPPQLTPQELIKVMCEWDSTLAPLTDRQRELCLGLQYMTFDAPLPSTTEHATDKLVLPTKTLEKRGESWSTTLARTTASQLEIDADEFVKQSEQKLRVISDIHDKANNTLTALHSVSQDFREAWNKMNSIYETCEKLEDEKKRLLVAADSIKDRLEPFQALEQITIKIHSTSIKTTSPEFLQQLARLAANVKFLEDNSESKEAEDFLDRYSAIREHAFRRVLSDCDAVVEKAVPLVQSADGIENFSQPRPSDTAASVRVPTFDVALCEEQLFTKFRADTSILLPLYAEIERLSSVATFHEFSTLLNQLKQSFCSRREKLATQLVEVLLQRLVIKHPRDICQFGRSGCALLIRLCCDEWNLFHAYFRKLNVQNDALDYYLSRLCERFYGAIRPQILNCSHVEQLSQLCLILASEAFGGYAAEQKQECAVFSHVVGQIILSDVQERLVYRTNVYINDQIAKYKPSAGDLAYPEKLIVMQGVVDDLLLSAADDDNLSTISNVTEIERRFPLNQSMSIKSTTAGSTVSGSFVSHSRTPADLPGLWYPPVRRTLTLIKRLSQSVDLLTFRNLTHEAINACLASLEHAAGMIRNQINKKGAVENSYLFCIKHIMILREAVMLYHAVDFSIEQTDLDFQSPIKRFALEFFARQQKQQQQQQHNVSSATSAVFASQSLAHVIQSLVTSHSLIEERHTRTDARLAIDDALRTTCRVLIDIVCQMFLGPLRSFLDKADAVIRATPAETAATSDGSSAVNRFGEHAFASPIEVHGLLRAFQERLCIRLGPLHRLLRLYMGETPSFSVLFRAIFDRIMSNAVQMQRLVGHAYSDAEREIIQCPSANDIAQLMMKICTAAMHSTSDEEVVSLAVAGANFVPPTDAVTDVVTPGVIEASHTLDTTMSQTLPGNAEQSAGSVANL